MTTFPLLRVGQLVLARRDPDLEPEEAEVKNLYDEPHTKYDWSARCSLRFVADGFTREGVPSDEVTIKDDAYDAEVLPRLPEMPDDPTDSDQRHAFATRFKEVGNDLFKAGQHAWAIRTYIFGLQQLQQFCFDEPFEVVHDERALAVSVAFLSNAALCALKLERFDLSSKLCDRGLGFASNGSEAVKLLMRKAQALLDAPEHSQPDEAVTFIERALEEVGDGDASSRRPLLLLLQRAKKRSKEKQKAADAALRGRLQGAGCGLRLGRG